MGDQQIDLEGLDQGVREAVLWGIEHKKAQSAAMKEYEDYCAKGMRTWMEKTRYSHSRRRLVEE